MKYVFISKHGDILPLAQRIEDEGNETSLYVCNDEGLLIDRHITDFCPDIIYIDSFGFGAFAERLRKQGFKVIGGSRLTDELENNKGYERRVLKTFGLDEDGAGATKVGVDGFFNGKTMVAVSYTVDGVSWMGEREDRLFTAGLKKLESALRKAAYSGIVSIDTFFNKDGLYFKNLRVRTTATSLLIMREALKGRLSNLLYALAYEQNRVFMFKPGWYTMVPLYLEQGELLEPSRGYEISVEGLSPEVVKHLWLFGFSKKTSDKYIYRGDGGRVAVATARGETVREARRRVYRTVFNTGIPNILFLKNVGSKASTVYSKLKEEKWIG